MKTLKKLLNEKKSIGLLLILFALFSSCKPTTQLYYKTETINKVESVLIVEDNGQIKRIPTNININIGSWILKDLSVSPKGTYLALSMMENALPPKKGKIEIYQNGRKLMTTFSNQKIRKMIEMSSNISYPNNVDTFIPYALGYEKDHVLIVHIQPQAMSDHTPLDVELKIDLKTNKVVGSPIFFERGNSPSFPTFSSKNRYNITVNNSEIFVNGIKLLGMPNNIDKYLYDSVTYSN